MDELTIGHVLDAAHAAALAPERTPELLAALARAFRCHFADSFTRTHDHSQQHGVAIGLDRADYEGEMLGVWSRRNVWGQRRPVRLAGEIVTTRDMVPRAELLRSEMYNAYLHPRGLHEGLRLAVWAGDTAIEDISLLRSWSGGAFSGEELRLARTLLPHLQRGAAVARRLRGATAMADAGLAALDAVAHASFLVEPSGRVRHMNAAAQALLAAQDGVALTATGLVGANPAGSLTLSRLVQQAAGLGTGGAAGGAGGGAGGRGQSAAARLPRPSGRPDLVVMAQPVSAAHGWALADARSVLLIISDPAAAGATPPARLQALYGLTPMEAAVALDLLAGQEVSEIARARGRSVATIRTHITRLLLKTGTTRQAELIRLLLRLPTPITTLPHPAA